MIGKKFSGFTLVELLVALMIFSLLSLLTLPSYSAFQNRQVVRLKAWEIKRALELGRSIAVVEHTKVKACLAGLNYACVSNLGHRFLVFNDGNSNHQWDKHEPIYKEIQIDDFTLSLSASGRPFVRFKPNGESMESGNIQVCNSKKTDFSKQIVFIYSGRIRMSKDDNMDGYDEKSGSKLTCNQPSLDA